MSSVEEMTLEYLMNKECYERYRTKTVSSKLVANDKDKKFYRKRINDVTKKLLNPALNLEPLIVSPDIKHSFDAYVKACVEYFKNIDKTDILQEDYKGLLDIDAKNEINIDNIATTEQADQLMMRSIKIKEPNNLEKLVKRKVLQPQAPMNPPQQKDVNLKDPLLKNKGICKKKNITNTYDDKKTK